MQTNANGGFRASSSPGAVDPGRVPQKHLRDNQHTERLACARERPCPATSAKTPTETARRRHTAPQGRSPCGLAFVSKWADSLKFPLQASARWGMGFYLYGQDPLPYRNHCSPPTLQLHGSEIAGALISVVHDCSWRAEAPRVLVYSHVKPMCNLLPSVVCAARATSTATNQPSWFARMRNQPPRHPHEHMGHGNSGPGAGHCAPTPSCATHARPPEGWVRRCIIVCHRLASIMAVSAPKPAGPRGACLCAARLVVLLSSRSIVLLDVYRLPRVADPHVAHRPGRYVAVIAGHVRRQRALLRLVLVLQASGPGQQQAKAGERRREAGRGLRATQRCRTVSRQ